MTWTFANFVTHEYEIISYQDIIMVKILGCFVSLWGNGSPKPHSLEILDPLLTIDTLHFFLGKVEKQNCYCFVVDLLHWHHL